MGNIREHPNTDKNTILIKQQKINVACSSMCGWRQYMEDAHIMHTKIMDDQHISLFGIFDGHGGPQVALFAKQHFVNCLIDNGYFITKNYEKALTQVFLNLDSLMLAKAGQKQLHRILQANVKSNNANLYEGQCIAGSTANVVLLTKDYVYCANVGDSRAIAILKDSKPSKPKYKQLSIDHKPDNQEQRKRIINAGGIVSDGRINQNLNLSRALGDFNYKKNKQLNPEDQMITAAPQIIKINRKQVHLIFMGCDGVWQTKSHQKMTKWIQKKIQSNSYDLGKTLQNLLQQQLSKSKESELGMDNMTAILIHLKN